VRAGFSPRTTGRAGDARRIGQKLWQSDTFVDFDTGLNKAITKIRDVLGDSAASPRFVETLPKRGYRFIAPIERLAPDRMAPAHTPPEAIPPEVRIAAAVESPRGAFSYVSRATWPVPDWPSSCFWP
jgi:DNA-binding winged helix-turn-helix (wHTH) protein